jgi:hypothetical protein
MDRIAATDSDEKDRVIAVGTGRTNGISPYAQRYKYTRHCYSTTVGAGKDR